VQEVRRWIMYATKVRIQRTEAGLLVSTEAYIGDRFVARSKTRPYLAKGDAKAVQMEAAKIAGNRLAGIAESVSGSDSV
jgi:nucleoside phosphorylase